MNILIVCNNVSIGGGTGLLSSLAPALARQEDIDLVRVALPPGRKSTLKIAPNRNLEVVDFDGDFRSPRGRQLIRDCHVVYFFWPHTMKYEPVDRPSICTFHDATILDFVPPFVSGSAIRDYWLCSEDWLKNMTAVVVPSNHVKRSLTSHYGEICTSAVVIPHAILSAKMKADGEVNSAIQKQLPKDYIIYPANTSPHKNHYNLFLAYARFGPRATHPLVLTGSLTEELRRIPPDWPEIPYLSTLTSLMQRKGLVVNRDLYPLGYIDDASMKSAIKHAWAMIMPSLSEGGGSYPVEEALTFGVPVLCSDIPVMREHLVSHSANVIWFDPESPDSILRALCELTDNYPYYKNFAQNSTSDRRETWDDVAQKYIHTFRQAYVKYHKL